MPFFIDPNFDLKNSQINQALIQLEFYIKAIKKSDFETKSARFKYKFFMSYNTVFLSCFLFYACFFYEFEKIKIEPYIFEKKTIMEADFNLQKLTHSKKNFSQIDVNPEQIDKARRLLAAIWALLNSKAGAGFGVGPILALIQMIHKRTLFTETFSSFEKTDLLETLESEVGVYRYSISLLCEILTVRETFIDVFIKSKNLCVIQEIVINEIFSLDQLLLQASCDLVNYRYSLIRQSRFL